MHQLVSSFDWVIVKRVPSKAATLQTLPSAVQRDRRGMHSKGIYVTAGGAGVHYLI